MKNTKLKEDIVMENKGKRRSTRNADKAAERTPEKKVGNITDKAAEVISMDEEAKPKNGEASVIPILNKIKEKCQGETLDRKVLVYEEELATTQDSLSDLNEFRSTCNNIESIVTEIKNLKSEESSAENSLLVEKRVDAMMLTTNLKRLNRLVQIRGKKAKENTLEVKSKVDGMHLELQNLLYEVMHMKKEIEKCMNFSSKDEEIDLVSVDKFYQDAPEEISKPDVTKDDPHKQMLSRLAWELKHRKELAAKKCEFLEQKKKVDAEIIEKSDYLVNLRPRLDQIIKVTLPVQEFMGMPIEAERLIFEKAQYLPRPLYVLYIQAKAFKDVCDSDMLVDIDGDIFEAKSEFYSEEVKSDYSDDSDTEQNENGDVEEKRGRKSKAANGKDRLDVQKKRLFRKHPLLVHIKLASEGQYELLLEFSYLPVLHISTVKVKLVLKEDVKTFTFNSLLEPSFILKGLLCADDGKISPNPSNVYQLKKAGITDISPHLNSVGIPYFWVQWICGLNYTPTDHLNSYIPDAMQNAKHFQSVINTIKSRLNARLSLVKQVQSLEQLIIPIPKKKTVSDVPPKIVTCLSSWKYAPLEDCQNIPAFKEFLEDGIVTEECSTYCATFSREKSLNSFIIIHENYPEQPPLILLSMVDGNTDVDEASDLACLEREINIYTDELTLLHDKNMILSSMLMKLQVCFDMFVETGIDHTSKEKLYTRRYRGRDRNRPYRYHKDGYFIHR